MFNINNFKSSRTKGSRNSLQFITESPAGLSLAQKGTLI